MRSNLASEKTTDKWASRSEAKVLLSEDNFNAFLWQGLQCCLALLRSSLGKRSARSGYYTRTEKKEQNTKQTSGKLVFLFFASAQAFKVDMSQMNTKFLLRLVTLFHWLVALSSGCESPSFSLENSDRQSTEWKGENEGTTSMLIMDPVSFGNEHQYLCTVTCKDMKREKAIRVEIYCEYFRQYLIFSYFALK